MVLMVSAILFLASRDPERNVAVVDGLIVGSGRPSDDAFAFAPEFGHSADLSWQLRLGAFGGQAAVCSVLFLSAAAGGALETCGAFLRNPVEAEKVPSNLPPSASAGPNTKGTQCCYVW